MKKKLLAPFLCVAMIIGTIVSVSAIYKTGSDGSLSAYLNAHGTSGYAGSEVSVLPYHVSASISCSWDGGSDSSTVSHDNWADPENITSYTCAEAYITANGTITSASSTHYASANGDNWSVSLG